MYPLGSCSTPLPESNSYGLNYWLKMNLLKRPFEKIRIKMNTAKSSVSGATHKPRLFSDSTASFVMRVCPICQARQRLEWCEGSWDC